MKGKVIPKRGVLTVLLLALLLLCAACGPTQGETESPDPGETASAPPEETVPAPAEPVEYDFSGVVLDEQTGALTGFEGLPWGYALPAELTEDLPEMPVVSIANGNAQFAGLNMMAYYSFQQSREGEGMVLQMGDYIRQGYNTGRTGWNRPRRTSTR